MNQPLVSVALCTYNGAQYLSQQLNTLINQTYLHIEIVVVDDCSTDSTFAILTEYAKEYPQFKIHQNTHNIGYVKNFERACKLCTGDLVALCDQDDIWHPDKITLQVNAIGNNVLIYHDSEFVKQSGEKMNRKMSDIMNLYRGNQPEVFLFFNCVSGHSILMKKELLNEALPLKSNYFHDWWLAYVATNIGTIDFVPQCLVQYRQHSESDTNVLRLKRKENKQKSASVQKLERIQQWLKYCAEYPCNKRPEIINQFYEAFNIRMQGFLSFELSRLLFKHKKTIFFIRKKSELNILNYICAQIWGAKAKRIFGKR